MSRTLTPPAWARRWAGPAAIVGSTLVVMHGFWLHPKLSNQHVDLLAFWLPRWCAMGTAVAQGHVATWLPNQFGGVPFASDPQSGWLYLPVFALFSTMSCARAMGLFLVMQPVMAGLGMYAFFRHEGLGRPAATVGGLTMALTMSGSVIVLSVPFSGTLAWTAVALAGASGYVRARTPVAILGWLALSGFAMVQIAAAHLTDGLLIGLIVVGLYMLATLISQVRRGERRARAALGMGIGLFAALPLLAGAVLIPRLALLPRTSIGHGYRALGDLATQLSGTAGPSALAEHGVGPWWGTSFARGPGGYVGALAILLLPVALASRRWRGPVAAFAVAGFIGWALNLDRLIASTAVRSFALGHGVGELWLRSPYRFRYLLILSFAALAGYGFQAWLDLPRTGSAGETWKRALWLAPALVVFAVAPLVAGASGSQYVPLAVGCAYAIPLLLLLARGTAWAAVALPIGLAAELMLAGLIAQGGPIPMYAVDRPEQTYSDGLDHSFPKFHAPWIEPAAYFTPGPIGRALAGAAGDGGRYLTLNPKIATLSPRGFLFHQDPRDWPAYENGRSILLGLEEIQGYSPVQVNRYWWLVRTVNRAPIYYNSATLQSVDPAVLRLFAVEWLNQPAQLPPPTDGTLVATEPPYALYRLPAEPRASVVFDVRTVATADDARIAVTDPSFDPATQVVVEGSAVAAAGPGATGTATYRPSSPERATVDVEASAPGMLVVRNVFDRNWTATVDGRPANVIQVDYLLQGVAVPAGRHIVVLTYRDRAVGLGLAVAAVAWLLLLGAWVWLRRRA